MANKCPIAASFTPKIPPTLTLKLDLKNIL
jgi:hypothetical protein